MKIKPLLGHIFCLKSQNRTINIMKITLFMVFICALQLIASNSNAQNVVIKLPTNLVTVETLFSEIEKQTDYLIVYSNCELNIKATVTLKNKKATVGQFLKEILKNTNLKYEHTNKYIVFSKKSNEVSSIKQESRKISGFIKDKNGECIIGANVKLKNRSIGTITDINGRFQLEAPENSILLISYIGYASQEINIGKSLEINIILKEDAEMLEEVVVVGYGTQKKVNLTGAVSQIKGEALESRPVTKISQALQGTIANLNISSSNGGAPGATQNINIRGYSSLGGTNSPLIVIDGVQGGSLEYLETDDVESISVLKDAASAAIYGSSAPFGAILITTKKGRKDSKTKITYSNNFGFAQPINLPKMANSLDFANIYNEAADNANVIRPFTDENLQRIKDYQSGKFKDETIANPLKDEWYTWTGNGNNDWFDIYFKDLSFSQQHNLGVSGGTGKTNYYVGLGYNQTGGLYEFGDDTYQRYSLRANLSSEITKWLSFNMRNNLSRAASDTPDTYSSKTGGNYMHQLARKWPTAPMYNPNGEYSYPSDIRLMNEGGRSKGKTDKAILTGEFVLTPLKGWNITANYTFDGSYYTHSNHTKTLYVTNPSGSTILYAGTAPNGFSRTSRKVQRQVVNAFTSYDMKIGKHSATAMLGYMQEEYDFLEQYSYNSNLYSDDLPSLSLTYGKTPSTSDNAYQLAMRGGFGRINYNYDEKYLLELNGRYDGTSRFLKSVRYKFYPGVSLGWVISRENFWKPLENVVNHMKLRGSYASLGDQSAVGYYPFYPSMDTKAPTGTNWLFAGGREAYVTDPSLINSDLTWIETTTIDFGFDMALFTNRLNISFDWFKRTGKNYVGPAQKLPAILGTTLPQTNDSEIETTGWDLTIGWKNHIKDFNYSANLVLSDYTGKVKKYSNPTGLHTTWYAGKKMGEIWGYETCGLFQSEDEIANAPSQSKLSSKWYPGDVKYADLNGDNKIDWGKNTLDDSGDKKIIGNTTPRYSFGLNLKADYKGWDFGVFFQGVGKRDAWISSNVFWGLIDGQWQSCVLEEHLNRYTADTPNGYFPRYYLNGNGSKNMQAQTRYLQNAAYVRLKNMQLGYSFPKALISKINFDRLRVFVSVDNLGTISNMPSSIDPELSASDGKVYPLQRTWSFGLNVSF